MADATPLAQRIKAEFDSRAQRIRLSEEEHARESQMRQARLADFNRACDDLRAIWNPRLEEFAKQFGDKIKVIPAILPSRREAKIVFLTELANMTLTLTLSVNPDATKLVLDYDLLIIPVLFEYQRYARLQVPLNAIDKDAVAKWIDDQLVSCVRAFLSIQDNEFYVRRTKD